ncbi:MAG TPA: SRPBCC family protein [Acidimicrobiales bacterium]|nr:SRPBCC family protein [Acidimicrobiales bacterium]
MQAQHDVAVARPVDTVFDFLADGTNNPYWQPMVVRTTPDRPGEPVGVGTVFRQRVRHPLGFTVSADYRLTVYERPTALALVVVSGGPVRPTMAYELAETGAAGGAAVTTVRCTLRSAPQGWAKLAAPLLNVVHPLFAWEAAWVDNARDILEL